MADYEVRRWRRYGKDRLYIEHEGVRAGWYDLLTGSLTVELPGHEEMVSVVVGEWLAGNGIPVAQVDKPQRVDEQGDVPPPQAREVIAESSQSSAVTRPASELPSAPTPEPEWVDLALNKPGQAAREQAKSEHDALKKKVTRFGAFVLKVIDEKTDERAWRVGADGEETVGALLEKLTGHGYHVLHSVPVGTHGSDIDHVLIGPPGVITINTKTHRDKTVWVGGNTVKVDGHNQPYVRNSRFEADRARQLLTQQLGWDPPVTAALIFLTGTRATRLTVKAPPDDVLVFPCSDVPGCFRRMGQVLNPAEVDVIFATARRSTTWLPEP